MSAFEAERVSDHAKHVLLLEAAMERAMKIQEVWLWAMARKIAW